MLLQGCWHRCCQQPVAVAAAAVAAVAEASAAASEASDRPANPRPSLETGNESTFSGRILMKTGTGGCLQLFRGVGMFVGSARGWFSGR